MTGPEHYREAERLLTEAAGLQVDYEDASTLPLVTRAQVHATLALAAATALSVPGGEDSGMYVADADAWEAAASAHSRPKPDPNPLVVGGAS